jgi:signal transduction histidine kinase
MNREPAALERVRSVRSILSVSALKQDTGPIRREAVDLRAVLSATIEGIDLNEAQSVERELRVHIPDGLAAWGDAMRVQQILTNFLSNAVKYSAPGTPVDIAARIIAPSARDGLERKQGPQKDRPEVEISVRDYGHGIPPEQLPLLFERFVRLPRDLASNVPGNGLGLHLCRAIAETMGGQVWAVSTGVEGEGATFHLQLPAAPGVEIMSTEQREESDQVAP